jgi:hypothetical protein
MKNRQEEWIELCREAYVERDPSRLHKLIRRINELLEAKENRLRMGSAKLTSEGIGVLQIAYDEISLISRAELLKDRGYEIESVLGNDDAKRIMDKNHPYGLVIVGHTAPKEERQEMVQWLRTNFPDTKILALNLPHQMTLAAVHYNVVLDGPEEWISIIATTVG